VGRLPPPAGGYGAFLRLGPELAVLSASPELFLAVHAREVRSDPIKGTRRRDPDPAADAALAAELLHSRKEGAELAMIVDLVRNDLHRVAVPGTVAVGPRRLTAHPTVHHAAQEVRATLAPGRDGWDAMAAAFPPGSVTGAPKVRACTRIAELEAAPRGVYCGAIGYAADGGDLCFNVAIRTAVWHAGAARYHVGGGIVADSDPTAEWWETVHKGAALGLALAGSAHPEHAEPAAREVPLSSGRRVR
jgi:para-aminobenzoate synthetase component 1